MKHLVYSVYDSAVKAYLRPMFMPSDGAAVRVFQDEVNKKDTPLNQHPDQYTLYRIGEFDDVTGIISYETPHTLGNGMMYKDSDVAKAIDPEHILQLLKNEIAMLGKDFRALETEIRAIRLDDTING